MKVLIVEDDAVSRKMIEMLIKPIVKKYDLAEGGQTALEFFKKSVESRENYNLVLLDIMLPEIDGQTLLRKFREIEKENNISGSHISKIIMVSALGDAGNVMEAFKNQCDGYLRKPYKRKELFDELKKLELID